jgi:hypothetical protein
LRQLEQDDAEVVKFVLLFEVVAIDEESWQLIIDILERIFVILPLEFILLLLKGLPGGSKDALIIIL